MNLINNLVPSYFSIYRHTVTRVDTETPKCQLLCIVLQCQNFIQR